MPAVRKDGKKLNILFPGSIRQESPGDFSSCSNMYCSGTGNTLVTGSFRSSTTSGKARSQSGKENKGNPDPAGCRA